VDLVGPSRLFNLARLISCCREGSQVRRHAQVFRIEPATVIACIERSVWGRIALLPFGFYVGQR
jgi:hypothetical protein